MIFGPPCKWEFEVVSVTKAKRGGKGHLLLFVHWHLSGQGCWWHSRLEVLMSLLMSLSLGDVRYQNESDPGASAGGGAG